MTRTFNKAKRVRDFFKNLKVTEGIITLDGKKIALYEIFPCSLLEITEQDDYMMFNNYLTTIKSMPNEYQIIMETQVVDFTKHFGKIYKNSNKLNTLLREISEEYIDCIRGYASKQTLYVQKFYVAAPINEEIEKKQIEESLKLLEDINIGFKEIVSREKIMNILRRSIFKYERCINEYR